LFDYVYSRLVQKLLTASIAKCSLLLLLIIVYSCVRLLASTANVLSLMLSSFMYSYTS